MGVPVSKLKATSQSVTLIVEKGSSQMDSKHQPDLYNVRLIESPSNVKDHPSSDQTTSDKSSNRREPAEGQTIGYSQLKYIDDNETSEESESFRKVHENDNDSGNASISSESSHHEDNYESESRQGEDAAETSDDIDLSQLTLRRPRPRKRPATFNFYSTLTNRLSTASFGNSTRYQAQSVLSQFEQSSVRKLVTKLKPGDLVEIRCVCNCLKSSQLRASLSHRQRFRRTLQRQSFHQMPLFSTKPPPQRSSTNLSNVFRRSCISGSMSDLHEIVPSDSKVSQTQNPPFSSNEQCNEQFHYVFVQKIDKTEKRLERESKRDLLQHVWCFHVRPYQRVALLEDDRHLGVVKHETLESIVGQFLIEMEERHWQFGRGFKQPKLSVYYQIRNQEKLKESILKQTLNAQPDAQRVMELLLEVKDSYVRYHRTLCNSEHYATLWKYGIGWSTWANGRTDILRALAQFVQSFAQLASNSTVQLQGGECLHQQTNLIVQCFGLHGIRLEHSIRQWIHSQIVITKSSCLVLPSASLIEETTAPDPSVKYTQSELSPASEEKEECVPEDSHSLDSEKAEVTSSSMNGSS